MSGYIYWVHEDALSLHHPALRSCTNTDSTCFVWDDTHLQAMDYSFQRLVFVYETLVEMNITVLRGRTIATLVAHAHRVGADVVRVPDSPNPAIQSMVRELREHIPVEVIAAEPFVALERPPNLRRFFSYWKSARPQLMRP